MPEGGSRVEPQTFIRVAMFLAAAMAQDSSPLQIQYNIEMTGGISVRGPALKERIINGGSCAQPPTPIHIWSTKVSRIQVAFNIVLAGVTGETGIPPSGTPWTQFDETSSVSVETPETGQTDDLIFGVNGTRNATGTVLYRPDGSGYFKFSNWKSATGKIEDGTISWTCKQEKR